MPANKNTVGTHRTNVVHDGETVSIIYHGTVVVKASTSAIILNTGGYLTSTTVRRMNEASRQFGLGYRARRCGGYLVVRWPNGEECKYLDIAAYDRLQGRASGQV